MDLLSEEWAAAAAGSVDRLPPVLGASGVVSLTVTGPARREVSVSWRYDDGTPVAVPGQVGSAGGSADGVDLVFTITSADAAQVISGEVDPSVAFMRGRLKASGDGALLLGFLESTTSRAFDTWRASVASFTAA